MTEHALLSASAADRWLHCPPSARLCEGYADTAGEWAQEGTDAHALCEYKLKTALGIPAEDPTENLTFYNAEMENAAKKYTACVMGFMEEAKKLCPDPFAAVEQRLDLTRWVPEGFGTADSVIVAEGTLWITDFKYGRGVKVACEGNPQLRLYALGALEMFGGLYGVEEIVMTVFQPRLANISESRVTKGALLDWAEQTVAPAARLAFRGGGDLKAGAWCRFCRAKGECRERAKQNLKYARYDFRPAALLTDDEVMLILAGADELTAWVNDVKAYALGAALKGREWPGWKVAEGRSARRFTDEKAAAAVLTAAGYDPWEKKLLGMTELQRMLGRQKFNELLGGLVSKPRGRPTLVPADAETPEKNTAQADFRP